MPRVATKATSMVMRIHAALIRASSVVISPTPKHVKMNARSSCIPSTAWSIEPSRPRSALPLPQTETKVIIETTKMLAQMQMVENRWRRPFATGLK